MSGADGEKSRSGDALKRASQQRIIHSTDLLLSLIILTGCAVLYYFTTQFEEVADLFAQDVQPAFFPRLLIWTIAILALLMPFEHLHLRKRNKDIDAGRRDTVKPVAFATAILLCVVVASVTWIGTWLAMSLACFALPMLWGQRRLIVVLPFAIVFPGAVVLLFQHVLGVYIEPGLVWAAFD